MNFSGHVIGAGIVGSGAAVVSLFLNLPFTAAAMVGGSAFLGGLAPDLDIASIPSRWFGLLGFLVSAIFFGLGKYAHDFDFMSYSSMLGMLALLMLGLKHRGPTHKYWLPLILVLLAAYGTFQEPYTHCYLYGFSAGICIHLVFDRIFPWNIFKGWLL